MPLHELNADLSVEPTHHATPAAENECEFVRDLMVRADCELCATRRNVADDAIEWVSLIARIDKGEIIHVVARTLTQFLERLARPEKRHVTISRVVRSPHIEVETVNLFFTDSIKLLRSIVARHRQFDIYSNQLRNGNGTVTPS